MRARIRLIGASLASVALLALAPAAAQGASRLAFKAPAARPTDHANPGEHGYTVPEAEQSPACGADFCVHWVARSVDAPDLTDANGNGVPDYVELVLQVAEHVHAVENDTLGWREPKSDGRRGGGQGKTDVYLKQIGGKLFGYAAPDRGKTTKAHRYPRRLSGYLVLDNNYSPSEFPDTTQLDDLEVTFAHEYNHILQFNYDAYQDGWFAESTAVWMEDQVYDEIDDYLRYVRRWVHLVNTPLTANSIKEYGSAVWNEWLAHRFGPAIISQSWSRAIHTKPGGYSVAPYDAAIRADGGPGFSRAFAAFATDLPEWRTATVFREGAQYPDVPRRGSLPENGRPRRPRLNHMTFQLFRVQAKGGRAVVVKARAPRGVTAGLALVGRVGSELHGEVVSKLRFKRAGGKMIVSLADPGRFQRITAVVVNADAHERGFSFGRLDWRYLGDSAPFEVLARVVR